MMLLAPLMLEHRLVEEVVRVFLRFRGLLLLVVLRVYIALKAPIHVLGEVVHYQALLKQRRQLRVQLNVRV